MRKTLIEKLFLLIAIFFVAAFTHGCSGGGGASAITTAANGDKPMLMLPINLSMAAGESSIPSTAVGSVEINIYSGAYSDPNKKKFNQIRADFASRKVEVGLFAGDTYSISFSANIVNEPSADIEYIYASSVESFYVPLETSTSSAYAAPINLSLTQTKQIQLYAARIEFSPLTLRTVKYGETLPDIMVNIYDQFARPFYGAKTNVTLHIDKIDNSTITPVISGQASVTPGSGKAGFKGISLSEPSQKTGVTRFSAAIAASSSQSSSVSTKSEDILIYNDSTKPAISKLSFEKQPAPLAGVNQTFEPFSVSIIDQYDNIVSTDEIITLSAGDGYLSGIVSVKATGGIAIFNAVKATAASSLKIKASISSGISVLSGDVKIISGEVSKSRLFVTNQTYIHYYDVYHGENSSKLTASAVFAGSEYVSGIKKIKPSFDKQKIYVLDDFNYFRVYSGLASSSLYSNIFNLGAFNTEKLVDFAPSIDNLSIYLASSANVYKWHIVNEPNFVISNTKSVSFSEYGGATEIKDNKLYLNSLSTITPYDFSQYPPKSENPTPIYNIPSGITVSSDQKYAAVAETRGQNIFLIPTGTETFERIPLGHPELSGNAQLKFSGYGGDLKLYMVKYSDGNLYQYNVKNGAGSVIITDATSSIKPLSIDTDKSERLIFVLNGSGPAFVRIFDAKDDSFVNDITLYDHDGFNISYYENVSGMVAY